MKQLILTFALSLIASSAMASFDLIKKNTKIVCYGEDNHSVTLNAKRTTIKYEVEGESLGAMKIKSQKTDGLTYITYATDELQLTLSNQGDLVQYGDEEAGEVECK